MESEAVSEVGLEVALEVVSAVEMRNLYTRHQKTENPVDSLLPVPSAVEKVDMVAAVATVAAVVEAAVMEVVPDLAVVQEAVVGQQELVTVVVAVLAVVATVIAEAVDLVVLGAQAAEDWVVVVDLEEA